MSGILKRKFSEEDGSSPCSLLPEFDDVSASDSGNSNDSVNPPTTQLMPSSILKRGKRMRMRGVSFQGVTVYYFSRRQGFTSVPTQGGSSLGMSPRHSSIRRFTLGEFAREQEREHRNMLRDHLKEEKINAIKLKLTKNGVLESEEEAAAAALTLVDIREEEVDVASAEVDEYFFLQPLGIRKRRALLRASGVRRIDSKERHQLRAIRVSRKECGCQCRGCCRPETCACSLAGIKCQVDRMSFPCGCSKDGCGNAAGRIEFNPARVRSHFLHTLMKLELEQQQQQQQHSLYLGTGNGYHGDNPLAQSQCDSDSTLMEAPNMHLDLANEAESDLPELEEVYCDEDDEDDEDEEEDEEDEEEDDDDEETEEEEEEESEQEEDEDGGSLLSGLSDSSTHSLAGSDLDEEEDEDDDDVVDERRRWEDGEDRMSRLATPSVSLPSVSLPSVSLASTMAFPTLPSFSEALREAEATDLGSYYSGSSPSTQYYPMDSYTSASTLHTSDYSSASSYSASPAHTAPNYTTSGYTLAIANPSYTMLNDTLSGSMPSHTQGSLYTGAEYTNSNHPMADYTTTSHINGHGCNQNHFNHYASYSSVVQASTDGSTKLCGTRNLNLVPSLDSFSVMPDSYKDVSQSQVQNGHHPYLLASGEHSTAISATTVEKNNYLSNEDFKDSIKKDSQVEFQNFLNNNNNNSQELPVENASHVGDHDLKEDPKQLKDEVPCVPEEKDDLRHANNPLEVNQA